VVRIHRAATAFDQAAPLYERVRPGYPDPAVAWLAGALRLGPDRRVLDLAAGTGKLTRALIGTGAEVTAVEPVTGMGRTLAAGPDRSPVVGAVAEALPFAAAVFDAVTVAQAFHWFANPEALGELDRVLRPGGDLGLVWNRRDESDPLQAAITALLEPRRGDTPSYTTGEWRLAVDGDARFAPTDEFHLSWRQPADVEAVAQRVATVSFVAALDPAARAGLLDEVRAAATAAAEVAPPLALAYVTDVFVFSQVGGRR